MSTNDDLANGLVRIKGYTIAVFRADGSDKSAHVVMEEDLKMTRLGGAHIINGESLLTMIEDAVFNEEKSDG